MFRLFLILVLAVSYELSAYGFVYASGGCDNDCTKCHKLSSEDVQSIIKKTNNPEAQILKIQMSPVRGLWEVTLDNRGQRGLFYIDFSKRFLLTGPIVEVNTAVDRTRQRIAELNEGRKINRSLIPLKDALVLGDKKASKKIIVFTDPDCPFCGRFHAEIKKVTEQRKDIAFYIKLYPLINLHPEAYWKSRSVVCNKSLELLEDNFAKKPISRSDCKTDTIDKNIKLAKRLGITGTPTSILPDGTVHKGFLEADKMIKIIDSLGKKGATK